MTTRSTPDGPVGLLTEITKRLGIVDKQDERDFLMDLSTVLDTKDWTDEDYSAFTHVFIDYRTCLDVMGPGARQIGLSVCIAGWLFKNPRLSIEPASHSPMLGLLISIAKTKPWA